MKKFLPAAAAILGALAMAVGIAAATPYTSDTLVTIGSPPSPFPQNKQNEPAAVVNPAVPSIAAAGANDEIDLEACNNRTDKTCPFTAGVGVSGIYFSDNGGSSWMQPTYSGWTARDCLGVVGTQAANPADNCDPHVGPIGTVPRYYESGMVADGDPALGFGPQRGANGKFSWANGWRLYYASLAANFSAQRSEASFKGFEAITVSRLDSQNYESAKAGNNNAWKAPVIVTKQNAALFSDHEMIAIDDAAISPFFGNVYVCDAAFRSQEIGGFPEPIVVNSSSDGGDTWRTRQVSPSVNNSTIGGRQDCAVNTDSRGTVYVFWDGVDPRTKTLAIYMIRSFDGGKSFIRPAQIVTHIETAGIVDAIGDLTFDGQAGARDGSFPTVDIANGAPTGAGATDQILLAWTQGPTPSDVSPGPNERVRVMWSRNQGRSWTSAGFASPASDRPDFPAVAISPDGGDAYLTYMNFLQPWQSTTANPRLFQGVVRHAEVDRTTGAIGAWSDIHRAPTGDARGSSANALVDEFLGDYDYAFATNDAVLVVWNDARNAADCPAIDAYRQDVVNGTAEGASTDTTRPAPNNQCPATFGNTDIFGGSYADPTP
ncbi:MAG: sialidase family protein [Gaiellaceae bacterium]